ncbi:hypothetical protein CLOM621_06296 [Clostridium sp. M62/1]|nr:hypothetical protein CLOM621_06296 [Clostridium sp. M62/1]
MKAPEGGEETPAVKAGAEKTEEIRLRQREEDFPLCRSFLCDGAGDKIHAAKR